MHSSPYRKPLQLNRNCKTIAREVEPIEEAAERFLPRRKNNTNPDWNNQKYKRRYCLARHQREAASRAGSRQLSTTRHSRLSSLTTRRMGQPSTCLSKPSSSIPVVEKRSIHPFHAVNDGYRSAYTGASPGELNSDQKRRGPIEDVADSFRHRWNYLCERFNKIIMQKRRNGCKKCVNTRLKLIHFDLGWYEALGEWGFYKRINIFVQRKTTAARLHLNCHLRITYSITNFCILIIETFSKYYCTYVFSKHFITLNQAWYGILNYLTWSRCISTI